MKRILTLFQTLLATLKASNDVPFSAAAPADGREDSRNWVEDYLIGMSDQDAIWYYERRRWNV